MDYEYEISLFDMEAEEDRTAAEFNDHSCDDECGWCRDDF